MKTLLTIFLILFIFSCGYQVDSSKKLWIKHEKEFVTIVNLIKAGKLHRIYGRMGYEIPDSFRLKADCGTIVFRETDFTYDSSFSILFRIGFDSSHLLRAYPTIVYTDNSKRLIEYNSKPEQVVKLKDHWYFLTRL